MIPGETLEQFLLGYGLEIPGTDGAGRPVLFGQLTNDVNNRRLKCDQNELLDALYNLKPNHAYLQRYEPRIRGFVAFEKARSLPDWKEFFLSGEFRIQILPEGRTRFQTLSQQLEMEQPSTDENIEFFRMAIEEARKSVAEDERPHPKVGAVIVKNGEVISKAHRGEVPKCHAEYIALEDKLPNNSVAGATVYTTMEPCTTRTDPKIPCVQRLIDRRVARVFIGMLDPDDRISGKGQRRLRQAGIETVLFPHEFAKEVEELNRDFVRFCEQRVRTEVGSANVELWKEVASLRTEFAEFRQGVETRENERVTFDNFPATFKFDQGSSGNYSGRFQNDSHYKVSIATIRILRGDTDHESPLTEAVRPKETDSWTFAPGESRAISWGSQYDPISMLKSVVQNPDPNFPNGKVIPIAIELTFTTHGRRIARRFVQQVIMQGNQMLPWGP